MSMISLRKALVLPRFQAERSLEGDLLLHKDREGLQ